MCVSACSREIAPRPVHAEQPTAAKPGENPGAARAAWLERSLSWPIVNTEAFVSAHLGRPHLAHVRVSPGAEEAYRTAGPGTHFEEGTWIVEWLRQRATGQSGAIFALERAASGWRFWVLRADGTVEPSANLQPCAECHAAAPAAPIFGPPRETQESTAPARRSP